MKKRTKIGVALTTLLSTTLVACGGGGGKSDKIKLLFWSTFNEGYQAVVDRAKAEFELAYPEYEIDIPKQTGTYAALATQVMNGAKVGNYPDLVAVYPDSVAGFMTEGITLNIAPYMNDPEIGWGEADFNDIPEGYIKEGQEYEAPGTFSLPFCKSTECLYYNRKKLVGLDLQNDDINDGMPLTDAYLSNLSWEELFEVLCPALWDYNEAADDQHKIMIPATDKNEMYIVGIHSDDNLFIELCKQYGLGYTSMNNFIPSIDWVVKNPDGTFKDVEQGYIDLFEMLCRAHKNHYLTTTGANGSTASAYFQNEGMLFSIGSTGGAQYAFSKDNANVKDIGVGLLPQPEDSSDIYMINQGPSISFLRRGQKGSEEQLARARGAWLFYKTFTGVSLNASWAVATGYAPIRKSVANEQVYIDAADVSKQSPDTLELLKAKIFGYTASTIDYLFTTPVFDTSGKVRTAVENLTGGAIRDLDPDSATFVKDLKNAFKDAFSNAL